MFFNSQRIIAAAIKTFCRHAPKVADTGHRNCDQPVKKLIHPRAAQRDFRTHWHFFTHPEARDRFLCLGDNRLLTSNRRQICLRRFGFLTVFNRRLTSADIQNNFVKAWDLHIVFICKFFFHRGADFFIIQCAQTGGVISSIKHRSRLLLFWRSAFFCRLQL